MNEIVNITCAPTLTMSSLEIAGLTGKRHHHVLRDIRNMLHALGEGETKFGSTYLDPQGKPHPVFNLPKRETLILVSGYATELRARIIDRWMELEAAVAAATTSVGTITDLGHEVRAAIGGIVKSIVHKELAEVIPALVTAKVAEQSLLIRRGKTAKEIWDAYNLPAKLRGATVWLGNRLKEMGASIEFEGKAERGSLAVRLFDPDKADVFMRNGLLHKAKVYATERMGQGRLRLVGGRA